LTITIPEPKLNDLLLTFVAWISISYRLPHLEKLDLQVCLSSVLERLRPGDDGLAAIYVYGSELDERGKTEFCLGPVMAFAESKMTIEAIDKLELRPELFGKMKTALEINVWRQLLPMRTKRDTRRIARIRRALEALDYDDVKGLREEELAVGTMS
jgi:hypothetical protein